MGTPTRHHQAPEGLDELSGQIFAAFKNVMHEHRHLMLHLLTGKGSHPAQAGCLQILAHREGMSQSDLAEMLHVSKPTVTTMLQKMERGSLIERRPDPDDQRRTLIFLSEKGREVSSEMRKVFAQVIEAGLEGMTEDDKRELLRLLVLLGENMTHARSGKAGDRA